MRSYNLTSHTNNNTHNNITYINPSKTKAAVTTERC